MAERSGPGLLTIGVGLFLLFAFLGSLESNSEDAPKDPPSAVVPATAEQKQACTKLMAQVGKTGAIRDRPEARRIDVDEVTWAGLPYKIKSATLACLAIDAYGTTDPPGLESTVAYGFHTGKRINQR